MVCNDTAIGKSATGRVHNTHGPGPPKTGQMFVGHEFLAFAVGVAAARLAGKSDGTALTIGLLAGASALLPDLDLLVGALSYASVLTGGATASWEGLWGVSNTVHRGVSHAVLGGLGGAVVLTATAVGVRSWRTGDRWPVLGAFAVVVAVVVTLLDVAVTAGGARETLSIGLVLGGAVVLGTGAVSNTTRSRGELFGAAVIGFLTHPFGDIFLAAPPQFLHPLDIVLLTDSVRLAPDPTLNLLAIALVELGTVWAGVLAYASVSETSIRQAIDSRALVGLGYPVLMAFVPTPTMVDAHWLGITLVPLAGVGLLARPSVGASTRERGFARLVTGLATMTMGALMYGLVLRSPLGL
jgi:hypothetical protein